MKTAETRKLSNNTMALLEALKKQNVGDYILRTQEALCHGDIDAAASAIAALANANRGVYDYRRRDAFRIAQAYFRYGHTLEKTLKRVTYSPVVWEYLQEYLKKED